jgi:hypothetical protein
MLTTTAHVTTWIWVTAFTASALLYLIPWSAGVEMHHLFMLVTPARPTLCTKSLC